MPEKVVVDILEPESPPTVAEGDATPEESVSDGGGTWRMEKLAAAGFLILLVVSICSFVLWEHLRDAPAAKTTPPEKASGVGAAVPPKFADLEGFVVDVRDGEGNIRILLCGLALEMEGVQPTSANTGAEIRLAVYEALRSSNVETLMTSDGKNGLKKEIAETLAKKFGGAGIRDVYFTKFVVL